MTAAHSARSWRRPSEWSRSARRSTSSPSTTPKAKQSWSRWGSPRRLLRRPIPRLRMGGACPPSIDLGRGSLLPPAAGTNPPRRASLRLPFSAAVLAASRRRLSGQRGGAALTPDRKQANQEQAGYETGHVGGEGNAAGELVGEREELHQEPDPEEDDGRQVEQVEEPEEQERKRG